MTEAEHLDIMHPWLRDRAALALATFRAAKGNGETIKVVESVRSLAVQQSYHELGRSKADGVSRFSLHQFDPALAFDVAVFRAGRYIVSAADAGWQRWGAAVEAHGLEWGGRWKGLVDCPHAQVPEGERVRLLQLAVGAVPDGVWGPATEAAIVKAGGELRPGKGWGRVTPATWAAVVA